MAKKKTAKKLNPASEDSFEESLARLESIVSDLEGGELGLSESLERYEEGIGRLKQCHAQLESAEKRVELLSGVDAEGNPITTDFDQHEDEALDAKRSGRSSKRATKKPVAGDGVDDGSRLF